MDELFPEPEPEQELAPFKFKVPNCICSKEEGWCNVIVDEPNWLSDHLGCGWAKELSKLFDLNPNSPTTYFKIEDLVAV